MPRGFILQPTYRIEAQRPVVQIYGKLETGESFLIRDTRERPRFFIAAVDRERAHALGIEALPCTPPRCTLDDREVLCVHVRTPHEVPALRDRLATAGVDCFEADVRLAYRYLIDRGIRGTLQIEGPERPGEGVDLVFDDPEVTAIDWTPQLSVLSLDIETDPRARQLLSIGLSGCGANEVLFFDPQRLAPTNATCFQSERELLEAFVLRVRELDPDVLTGWNVLDFDLALLSQMAHAQRVRLTLGRGAEPLRLARREGGGMRGSRATLPGRVVLDGIDLLRGAFVRMESYSLNAVAQTLLGKGKKISGSDRATEILRQWREDPVALAEYNLVDAQLVLEILEKLRLIPLTVERSRLTGMPPDRVAASVASFEFLYLSELTLRQRVAPMARSDTELEQSGGHVITPRPGLYRNVWVFDFQSLYPSLMRTFNIDPLALVQGVHAEHPICAPNKAQFSREPGILPALLDRLTPLRQRAKLAGDTVSSQAIKILMNSFYGVLGTAACRFADARLPNAITAFGREILLWASEQFSAAGYEVLYGDTDSLFVASGLESEDQAAALGAQLAQQVNSELDRHIRATWDRESRVELEFETLYLRLLLPHAKHGVGGAAKRYAGLVRTAAEPHLVLTGLEAVRRDWTALARRVQRELFERLFHDADLKTYIRELVAGLRAGRFDAELVYRKTLRRALESYTRTTPPHVAAARKIVGRKPRVVRYVMTTQGPEPIEAQHAQLDHEHYVQKQVRAVAEPILRLLDLEFDKVVGDDSQLSLF